MTLFSQAKLTSNVYQTSDIKFNIICWFSYSCFFFLLLNWIEELGGKAKKQTGAL